jgi:hypothetical protein
MNLQQHQRPTLLALVVFALLGAAGLLKLPSLVASSRSATAADVTQTRIARAMSAGPADIARSAKIIDTDAHGKTLVLREGSNGFTCMPGDPYVIGEPAMCVDAASLQWFADAKAHKPRRPTRFLESLTCLPEPLSAVIPTRTTRSVQRSTLVRTG